MAEYYSLEEAAGILGISVDDLNQKAQRREIRAFSDRGSWKFSKADVDAFASSGEGGDDIMDDDAQGDALSAEPTMVGKSPADADESDVNLEVSKPGGDDDSGTSHVDLSIGDSTVTAGDFAFDARAALGGDSDISADDDAGSTDFELAVDSDVGIDENVQNTDLSGTVELPLSSSGLSDAADDSGEDLDFNFDDDLETGFKLDDDVEAEIDLSNLETSEGDAAAIDDSSAKSSSDSDFALEADDSGSDFELSLESDDESNVFDSDDFSAPGFKDSDDELPAAPAAASKPVIEDDEEEEEEEVAEDDSEDSDFELEIEDDESGSEVVALDEDDDEVAEDIDFDADEEEFDEDFNDADEYEDVDVADIRRGAAAAEEPWPNWMLAPLAINVLLLSFCGMMMFEIMRHAWSFEGPSTITATIIEGLDGIVNSIFG